MLAVGYPASALSAHDPYPGGSGHYADLPLHGPGNDGVSNHPAGGAVVSDHGLLVETALMMTEAGKATDLLGSAQLDSSILGTQMGIRDVLRRLDRL